MVVKFKLFEINKKLFPKDKFDHVADIGIGCSEMLTCMRDWGFDCLGVDISPSTVRFCQSIGLNCQVVANTAAWLRDSKNKFSLIAFLDVL